MQNFSREEINYNNFVVVARRVDWFAARFAKHWSCDSSSKLPNWIESLLTWLICWTSCQAVQPHLRKCFDAIALLDFVKMQIGGDGKTTTPSSGEIIVTNDINAMVSPEGESVCLGKGLKGELVEGSSVCVDFKRFRERMFANKMRSILVDSALSFDAWID